MSDNRFDSFFIDSVCEMLNRYPDVKYIIDSKNHIISIDTQGDNELDNYLALKIYGLAEYWGTDDTWAL